ncbi:MAG: hypothetical protein Tsb0014_34760 [Pleurocapsa sp.]
MTNNNIIFGNCCFILGKKIKESINIIVILEDSPKKYDKTSVVDNLSIIIEKVEKSCICLQSSAVKSNDYSIVN